MAGKKTARKPARRKPAPKGRKAARKPAKARRAKAPARKRTAAPRKKSSAVTVQRGKAARPSNPGGPPPPPPDAIEVSGIYERVMYSENDPYQEVREIFGHYDRNKTGVIEAHEFVRLCQGLGVEMNDEELKIGLGEVDADGDGKITWNEFLAWWRSIGH